jgi:hypothetical protein
LEYLQQQQPGQAAANLFSPISRTFLLAEVQEETAGIGYCVESQQEQARK